MCMRKEKWEVCVCVGVDGGRERKREERGGEEEKGGEGEGDGR